MENAAVGVVSAEGVLARRGAEDRVFPWASVTKLVTAGAVLVAAEEGIVELDEPAGPPGATLRHLLSHASGLPLDGERPLTGPGTRRIYSNTGIELAAALVSERAEMPFEEYLAAAVLEPVGMAARLDGSPASGLVRVARRTSSRSVASCWRRGSWRTETLAEAATVAFPGLAGVLPGYGRQDPNDWGLGFELRDGKAPHWTGARNSPRTFGHFGRAGTFLWVDPEAGLACACLTDRDFGDWSREAWPVFSDAVLESFGGS